MRVVETYSHKDGERFLRNRKSRELRDIYAAVAGVNATSCLRKVSREKTKPALLFHPETLNLALNELLCGMGWMERSPTSPKKFRGRRINFGKGGFREMDGIKHKVGLEIQFGKYAFMAYDIFSKMPIFARHGLIECGIEVVAMPEVVRQMSTGVSSFTQIVRDMRERGEADVDIPTLILGIGLTEDEVAACQAKLDGYQTNPRGLVDQNALAPPRRGARPGPKSRDELLVERAPGRSTGSRSRKKSK